MRTDGRTIAGVVLATALSTGAGFAIAQQATDTSGTGTNPLGGLFRGIGSVFNSILSPKAGEVRRLLEAGQAEEAARLAQKNPEVLEGQSGAELKIHLAKALNSKLLPALEDAIGQLERSAAEPSEALSWGAASAALKRATEAAKHYDSFPLLTAKDFRAQRRLDLDALLTATVGRYEAHAPTVFLASIAGQLSSNFASYPVSVDSERLLVSTRDALRSLLPSLPALRLAQFWTTYGRQLAATEQRWFAEVYMGKALGERIAANASFSDIAVALRETKELNLPVTEGAARGIALIQLPAPKGAAEEFPIRFQSDLPFGLEAASLEQSRAMVGPEAARYVMAVRVKSSRAIRKVPEREAVSSRYESGSMQVPNPAYEQARIKYASAENDYTRQRIQSATTPTYNALGALAKALADGVAAAARNQAAEELARTPPTVTEPTYTNYTITVSKVDSTREAQVEIFLIDRASQKFTRFVQDIQQSKRFELAYNIHDKDAAGFRWSSRFAKEADIAKYEKEPYVALVSDLLRTVQSPSSSVVTKEYVSEAILVRDMEDGSDSPAVVAVSTSSSTAEQNHVKDDSRMRSVVFIRNPKGGIGAGFFVAPDLVITNAHVVEGANFADVKLYDGKEAFGKVLKADISLDLALIRLSERGEAIRFVDGQVSVGSTVDAIGHPRGLEFSLTRGVVSGIRKRAELGGKEVLLVQTDAPISPGNSGGPLFLGDRVLGVNTAKLGGRDAEGLGFAVHASEIQRFIAMP